ncbi:hypothetical protein GGX14DRAFT_576045 [Mycena pura]|uniref:Uncharacterized protein n=1 Tax=Mycena pura TaxID=153505 RepID=A0AAD6UUB0_9AGAR|nr:hypothetical protein GGX14DRAFT_576045 [Mycena pura]
MPSETTPLVPTNQTTEIFLFNTYKLAYLLFVVATASLPELVLDAAFPSWTVGARTGVAIMLLLLRKTYFAATAIHRVTFYLLPLLEVSDSFLPPFPTNIRNIIPYTLSGIIAFPFAGAFSVALFSLGVCYRNDVDMLDYIDDMKQVRFPSCPLLPFAHVRRSRSLQPTTKFNDTTTKPDPASDDEVVADQTSTREVV